MLKRLVIGVVVLGLFGLGSARAGEEELCSAQYTLEEHSILEWAALGGDPHAQFAVAQCAYPEGARELTASQKVYALKWLTLATCDASGTQNVGDRDRLTRKLKFSSDLSFRRFGGITGDERWTSREKEFVEFRNAQIKRLDARFQKLNERASNEELAAARQSLADDLSRMGGLGLLRLSEMTSCSNFGASKSFAAASWAATDYVWATQDLAAVYGESAVEGWSIARESADRFAALSQDEKRVAAYERARLLQTTPTFLAKLENEAALGRMQNLGVAHVGPNGDVFTGNTAPLAAQYALEALGFMVFVNGPDNDYGPTTIEAVRKAQEAYGAPQTRWLSHEQVRQVVCDAAVKKSDPVSYFHLATMFSQGWGFPQDYDRAEYAIARADNIMQARLSRPEQLAEWKQNEYPKFVSQIERAKTSIVNQRTALPFHVVSQDEKITDRNLCE